MKRTKYFTSGDGSLYLELTTPWSSNFIPLEEGYIKLYEMKISLLSDHPRSEAQSRISNCPKYTKQLARIQLCSSQCINLNYRPDPHTKYCGLIVYDKQPRHLLGWSTMGSYTSMELQSFAIAKIFYKIWIQMRLWPSVKFYLKKTLDLSTFF